MILNKILEINWIDQFELSLTKLIFFSFYLGF
jgi:hypothetical protein